MATVACACSCGKDSIYNIECAYEIGLKPDFVYSTLCWFDDDTPADLPEVYEAKLRIKDWVEKRYGIPFIFVNGAFTYADRVVGSFSRGHRAGRCRGFPTVCGPSWCQQMKVNKAPKVDTLLVGIASDEKKRLCQLSDTKRSPMAELGRTEADAFMFCEQNGVLLPSYSHGYRDGCWFCNKQPFDNLRRLRIYHPHLWDKLMSLDDFVIAHDGYSFRPGFSVHDLDERFSFEGYQDRWF